MKSKMIAGLTLAACLFLVTGCQNPIEKAADKIKNKAEETVEKASENVKESVKENVKEEVKETIKSATAKKLSCSMSKTESGMTMNMVVDLDYDMTANKPKNISMEMKMQVGAETLEAFKTTGMDLCTLFGDDNDLSGKCTSSTTSDSVTLKYEIDETEMTKMLKEEDSDSEIHTYAELKAAFEKEGFTCK